MEKNKNIIKVLGLLFALMGFSALFALCYKSGLILTTVILLSLMVASFSSIRLINDAPWLYLSALPVFEIVWLITHSYLLALFSLLFLPAGFMLAKSLKNGMPPVSAILHLSILFGCGILVFLLIFYVSKGGKIKALPDAVKNLFVTLQTELNDLLAESVDSYIALIKDQFSSYNIKTEDISAALLIETVVSVLKSTCFAIFILLVNAIAFFSYYLGCLETKLLGFWSLLPASKCVFLPSKIGAVLFIASYLVQVLLQFLSELSSGLSYIYIVALNLTIILIPVFFIMGIRGIVGRSRIKAAHRSAIIIIVVFFFLLIFNFLLAFYLLAFLGAWDTLAIYRVQKIQGKS